MAERAGVDRNGWGPLGREFFLGDPLLQANRRPKKYEKAEA